MANVNPIPYTGPAATDLSGVLTHLVRLPVDNSPYEDESGVHYEEKFKGPYLEMKEVLSHIKYGDSITSVHTSLSARFGGLNVVYEHPTCPSRDGKAYVWTLRGIRVEEAEAGAHSFLYLKYDSVFSASSEPMADEYQDVWSLQWQAYTVDPYAFCSNSAEARIPCSPSFDTSPEQPSPSWDKKANRANIDQYLNCMPNSAVKGGKTFYYYTPNEADMTGRYFINDVEAEIMKKKMLGRSAVYHYPVLTHQTVTTGSIGTAFAKTLGESIDHTLSALPAGCPYSFDSKWTFVKTGDECQQTKTRANGGQVTFTHRETFSGFIGVDLNFYGNGAFDHTEAGILSGRWVVEGL